MANARRSLLRNPLSKPFLTVFMLCALILLSLTGCGSQGNNASSTAKNPSVSAIGDKIAQTVDLSKMKTGDDAKLQKLYGIDPATLDGFVLYTAPSNIQAEELAILKVKDPGAVGTVKNKLAERVDAQATSFKDYLPEEYALIEKHVLKAEGNYVLLAISKDSATIEKTFDEMLK